MISSPGDEAEREASRIGDAFATTTGRPDAVPSPRVDVKARPRAAVQRSMDPYDQRLHSAQALIPWIDTHPSPTPEKVFAAPDALALIIPKPTKIEDVKAVLDLLVTLGVLHAPTTPGGPYLRAFDIDAPRVPEFGDQKSTAPIAESLTFHPQREFAQHYMELAGKLLPWIDARTSPFTRADLFADKQAMALVGNPKTDEELRPMLDLLVKYGVLSSKPDGKFQPMRAGAALSTERFDKATKDIADPAHTAAKPRFNYPQPIHDLTTAPRSTWNLSGHDDIPEPGGKTRQVSFKDRATAADKATQEIADLEQQLKAAPSGPGKEALTKKLEEQKRILDANTKHWQFAPAVSKFLDTLRKLTDSSSDSNVKGWVAATYSGHQWEEYSADMNLGARSGPWPEAAVIEFFTKLDQAAVTEGMAWRAIYDPDDVRAKLTKMFGERRVIADKPNHSDHIHLNVRPTKLDPSEVKGFK